MGIIIRELDNEIKKFRESYGERRKKVHSVSKKIVIDLERRASDNAPVKTGALAASGNSEAVDLGEGRGFRLSVWFDTDYALKMHESHYIAHDPHEAGKSTRSMYRKIRIMRGGVRVTQEVLRHGTDGMWRDSRGNWRGRKYLQRAFDANWAKYKQALEAIGER